MAEPMANVFALLMADPDVTALVGDRIYPTVAPDNAEPPFIIWQLISNVPYNSLDRVPDADSQRVQVDCYDADPARVQALAFTVRDCLQTNGTVLDGPVPLAQEPDTHLHRWTLDAQYFHERRAT